MVNEVRRQFKEIPGLLEGKAKPDYSTCLDISTRNALKEIGSTDIYISDFPSGGGFHL